ncbi:polysaccharide biosynthesis/export family protein, partial [Shewanella indica]
SFAEAKDTLKKRIKHQMIGIESNITMGELRSIRIFVAGDAYKPGSYTVSSLSTMTQALFVSGGVNEIGSLRKVQLKRGGKLVGTLDLYDLLMRGDASGDL